MTSCAAEQRESSAEVLGRMDAIEKHYSAIREAASPRFLRLPCPAHEGTSPNLVLRLNGEKILAKCLSRDCSVIDIAFAILDATGVSIWDSKAEALGDVEITLEDVQKTIEVQAGVIGEMHREVGELNLLVNNLLERQQGIFKAANTSDDFSDFVGKMSEAERIWS